MTKKEQNEANKRLLEARNEMIIQARINSNCDIKTGKQL